MLQNADPPVVYILDMNEPLTDIQLDRIKKYIPYERIRSSERFLRKKDSDACLASFFLLVYGLRKLGISELPETEKAEYGKPYFIGCDICFNISHCDKAVCCGISGNNIGVDIQDTVNEFDDIIGLTMSVKETGLIKSAAVPSEAFTRSWAIKESYVKFMGCGLTDDVRTIEFLDTENDFTAYDCFFRIVPSPDYQISACTAVEGTVFVRKELNEYLDDIGSTD